MGFEILPIEDGEIDEVDPMFDIFEITGAKKWIPARFRTITQAVHIKPDPPECKSIISEAPKQDMAWLEKQSFDELIGKDEYKPAYDGLPDLEMTLWTPEVSLNNVTQKKSYENNIKPWHRVVYPHVEPEMLQKFLGWRPTEIVKQTLEHTTQLAKTHVTYPLQRHFKARNPFSNVHRLDEVVSTDPLFANCPSLDNKFTGAQIFFGLKCSKMLQLWKNGAQMP